MLKIKKWLCERFLPAYCREELLNENKSLSKIIERQNSEIARLKAYISGVETSMRYAKRINIHNEVSKE